MVDTRQVPLETVAFGDAPVAWAVPPAVLPVLELAVVPLVAAVLLELLSLQLHRQVPGGSTGLLGGSTAALLLHLPLDSSLGHLRHFLDRKSVV